METIALFVVEYSIINTVPILLAAIIVAFLLGPFLISLGATTYWRALVYAFFGMAAGLLSYATFDIPGRSIEIIEGIALSLGMAVYGFLFTAPITAFRSKAKPTKRAQG